MIAARKLGAWAAVPLLACGVSGHAQDYSFDSAEFEKKPFELGGYLEFKQESLALRRGAAFYDLGFYNLAQRESLDRSSGTLQLAGKLRHGIGTFDFRTNSNVQRDQLARDHDNSLYEAAYSIRPSPGFTVEAGKRSLKWGKGYAWNPIGFVDRPKDPNDPQLAREGFVMADADWIASPGGALQTIAFTPVLLPVSEHVNGDFGARGHLNPAAKLYLLYRDTDIDFAWQGKGSRPARFGMDFSRNLASNFEIHGEWARIQQVNRPVTTSTGVVTNQVAHATSSLIGARYLTASETTYVIEYYRNGTGYSEAEARQFYDLVGAGSAQLQQAGSSPLFQKALSLAQGGYGRPNAGRDYVYLRAQMKDALGIVYFMPALTAMMNWQDRSFQATPELQYTGFKNVELRLRLFLLHGASGTEFGEKQVSRKLEFHARYYF
jgi:hypothetical protein